MKKAKWYQFKVCEIPDKCDMAVRHEVVWVPDEEPHHKLLSSTPKDGAN